MALSQQEDLQHKLVFGSAERYTMVFQNGMYSSLTEMWLIAAVVGTFTSLPEWSDGDDGSGNLSFGQLSWPSGAWLQMVWQEFSNFDIGPWVEV